MSAALAAPATIQPKSGLEQHGIRHLSASSLNLFAAEPALWVMEKLLGKRGKVGCAAHRGTAAELGIVHGLMNPQADIAECQAVAVAEYERLTALSGDPRRVKEGEAVPGIVATALPELRLYGVPDEIQKPIEVWLPEVPVKLIGFLDVGWSRHGITLDIKTQLRLSSDISTGHGRQVGLYVHGTNREARIAYCTPQKIGVYRCADPAAQVETLRQIAIRLNRFLSLSADKETLAGVVVPDVDSFYYSEPNTRAMAREVFGL
jgi:hypothetical protein